MLKKITNFEKKRKNKKRIIAINIIILQNTRKNLSKPVKNKQKCKNTSQLYIKNQNYLS